MPGRIQSTAIFVCALLVFMIASAPILSFSSHAESLFEAEYPAAVSMPEESAYLNKAGEIDFDRYYEDYDAWIDAQFEKRLRYGEGDALIPYFAASSREILAREDQKNKVFSPVNVYLALSMLGEITDGDTRSEILAVLSAESMDQLRAQANKVFLSVYENDGRTLSSPASSVWLRDDISYKPDVLRILSEEYFASSFSGEMGSREYDSRLQKWLNDHTGGLLQQQAENITLDPEGLIALVTSLYYKAGWTNEFSKSGTATDVFHAAGGDTQAEFMKKSSLDIYYRGENFGAVALSMTNGGEMWLFLPDEGISPESLFEDETLFTLMQHPDAWKDQKWLMIHKSVPKFDVTGENDLIGALKNLGIRSVFDPDVSDFTPLTDIPEIAVSKAQHDVRVKINEEGAEAAAYTVIMAVAGSARPMEQEEMDFIADRPFAFVITSQDGLALFAGVVNHTGK